MRKNSSSIRAVSIELLPLYRNTKERSMRPIILKFHKLTQFPRKKTRPHVRTFHYEREWRFEITTVEQCLSTFRNISVTNKLVNLMQPLLTDSLKDFYCKEKRYKNFLYSCTFISRENCLFFNVISLTEFFFRKFKYLFSDLNEKRVRHVGEKNVSLLKKNKIIIKTCQNLPLDIPV